MPFDSKGNFSRLHNWEDDRINDIEIITDHMDAEDNNFADGLSQCFLKTGYSKMQGDFDAGNFKLRNVANGIASLDAVNKSQLDSLKTAITPSLVPSGTILPYGGTTVPSGYLLCDGSAVSRTTYAALFAVIGTTYGSGDGSTTFNLPQIENLVYDINTDVPCKGNNMSLGLINGGDPFALRFEGIGGSSTVPTTGFTGIYGQPVGTASSGNRVGGANAIGVTTDASKSGIVGTITRTILSCKHIIKY